MTPKIAAKEAASLLKDKRVANAVKARVDSEALRKLAMIGRYQTAVEILERQIIEGPVLAAYTSENRRGVHG